MNEFQSSSSVPPNPPRRMVSEDLTAQELRYFDGTRTTFREVDFSGTDLQGADFEGSVFQNCRFRDTDLRGANLQETRFIAVGSGAAPFERVRLTGSFLRWALFQDLTMESVDLRGADLLQAGFHGCALRDVDLRMAFIVDVVFTETSMERVQLDGSEAYHGRFQVANLADVSAIDCDLQELGMDQCSLHDVEITNATLTAEAWTSMRQEGVRGWERARIVARDPNSVFAPLTLVEAQELCR